MTTPIYDRLANYLDAFERAVIDVAPHAAEAALLWARIDAASGLVGPLLLLVSLSWIGIRWGRSMWEWARSQSREDREPGPIVVATFASGLWSFFAFICAAMVFNIWRWVGIFYPEMWIIHKTVSAITGQ